MIVSRPLPSRFAFPGESEAPDAPVARLGRGPEGDGPPDPPVEGRAARSGPAQSAGADQ